ncbi:2-oxo acid dehydrogenase subunit E2 [Planctomycetota bacterium]
MESAKRPIRLTRIQKLIGERMQNSKRIKPCFYIASKVDVTEMMALRPKLRKSLGVKITTNTFYVRTLALAISAYPLMAGTLEGENVRIADEINVGFALNAPQGLVVPVIKNADTLSLAKIAQMEKVLTEKARDNKLMLEEMEGETAALSNLGAYGIDFFIGIVPPPTSVILSVGNVIPTVVCENKESAARKMVVLTVAADRRIISEVYAAKFLKHIKEQLQEPEQLIQREIQKK